MIKQTLGCECAFIVAFNKICCVLLKSSDPVYVHFMGPQKTGMYYTLGLTRYQYVVTVAGSERLDICCPILK